MRKRARKKRIIVAFLLIFTLIGIFVTSMFALETIKPGKEIEHAEYDLKAAKRSLADEDYKWATVQAYFSVYHASQIILGRGWTLDQANAHKMLSESMHQAETTGKVPKGFADDFDYARWARTNANYRGYYYEDYAKKSVRIAERFLKKAEEEME